MARKKKVKVKDLPPDKKVTQEELDEVTGGAGLTSPGLIRGTEPFDDGRSRAPGSGQLGPTRCGGLAR